MLLHILMGWINKLVFQYINMLHLSAVSIFCRDRAGSESGNSGHYVRGMVMVTSVKKVI